MGIMVQGGHHQLHHLAMARGEFGSHTSIDQINVERLPNAKYFVTEGDDPPRAWTREGLQIGTRRACSALQRVSLLTEVFETRLALRSPFRDPELRFGGGKPSHLLMGFPCVSLRPWRHQWRPEPLSPSINLRRAIHVTRQPCVDFEDDDPARKDLIASATGPGNSSCTESLPRERIVPRTFGREARASISAFDFGGVAAP
jgi:hypothetical protein